jgi:hypothetical protein
VRLPWNPVCGIDGESEPLETTATSDRVGAQHPERDNGTVQLCVA